MDVSSRRIFLGQVTLLDNGTRCDFACGVLSLRAKREGKMIPLQNREAIKALARLLWPLEPSASGVNLPYPAYAPQPNETFNADANIGHGFAIFMANVGALRPYRASGAG
jgi:hypothetical protein